MQGRRCFFWLRFRIDIVENSDCNTESCCSAYSNRIVIQSFWQQQQNATLRCRLPTELNAVVYQKTIHLCKHFMIWIVFEGMKPNLHYHSAGICSRSDLIGTSRNVFGNPMMYYSSPSNTHNVLAGKKECCIRPCFQCRSSIFSASVVLYRDRFYKSKTNSARRLNSNFSDTRTSV